MRQGDFSGERHMKRFRRWAIVSLIFSAASIWLAFSSHNADSHHYWVHYATSHRWPVVVDGQIEFGFLGAPQPFDPTRRDFSWDGPYTYSEYTKAHPLHDTDDNFAREVVFSFGGLGETRGRIVPPWGWKNNVFSGDEPSIAIAYTEFRVSMIYPVLGFAIVPLLWWKRTFLEGHR
jgi:hypothetical protein